MEALILPKEMRTVDDSPLPALKHLKVKTAGGSSSRVADLQDVLSCLVLGLTFSGDIINGANLSYPEDFF